MMISRPNLISKVVVGRFSKPIQTIRFSSTKTMTATEYATKEKPKRPWSPHVTIYKFPFPALTSIAHRITGVALSGVFGTLGVLSLAVGAHEVPLLIDSAKTTLPFLVPLVKFTIAFPTAYHTLFGIRHLYWDRTGEGIDLKTAEITGQVLVGASIVAGVAATFV